MIDHPLLAMFRSISLEKPTEVGSTMLGKWPLTTQNWLQRSSKVKLDKFVACWCNRGAGRRLTLFIYPNLEDYFLPFLFMIDFALGTFVCGGVLINNLVVLLSFLHTSCYVWGGVRWVITSWYANVMLYCTQHTTRHATSGVGWGGVGNNVMVR